MTQDQENTLKSWAEERDKLMSELAPLRAKHEEIVKKLKLSSENHSDIEKAIIDKNARLETIEKFEKHRVSTIANELSDKIVEKTKIENEIKSLTRDIAILKSHKEDLANTISILLPVIDRVKSQTDSLLKTLDNVIGINKSNTADVNIMVSNLKKFLSEINISKLK